MKYDLVFANLSRESWGSLWVCLKFPRPFLFIIIFSSHKSVWCWNSPSTSQSLGWKNKPAEDQKWSGNKDAFPDIPTTFGRAWRLLAHWFGSGRCGIRGDSGGRTWGFPRGKMWLMNWWLVSYHCASKSHASIHRLVTKKLPLWEPVSPADSLLIFVCLCCPSKDVEIWELNLSSRTSRSIAHESVKVERIWGNGKDSLEQRNSLLCWNRQSLSSKRNFWPGRCTISLWKEGVGRQWWILPKDNQYADGDIYSHVNCLSFYLLSLFLKFIQVSKEILQLSKHKQGPLYHPCCVWQILCATLSAEVVSQE